MDYRGQDPKGDPAVALPQEVMAHILGTLPEGSLEVAARVCRSWRATAIALADVGGTRGPLTGTMGLRTSTINHAAAAGHKSLIDWLRRGERSPWSQDTAVAALHGGHMDVFDFILATGGTAVIGTRLAAASLVYGGMQLLRRVKRAHCPVDEWTLMVAAAVLPLDSARTIVSWGMKAPAHTVAALLGRTDLLDAIHDSFGTLKLTQGFRAVLDSDIITHLNNMPPRLVYSNNDTDRLCNALAQRGAGLSAHALAKLLLDLQREGYSAKMFLARGLLGPTGPIGAVGPTDLIGPSKAAGPTGVLGPMGPIGS